MCIAPITLPEGVVAACHECWQCKERAINDWVGRNIAESKSSTACHAVTLTYGRNRANDVDHERATVLTYSDVQKYLKLLRRHGFPVRYFVTGEFGSRKGRAHWHIMLYWQKDVPEHVLDQRFDEQHWPHGWSFWTKPTAYAVRYNCKYIQKDMGDEARQGHLAMSKKPPLGTAYFQVMAEQYVRQGLAPQTLEYTFPDVRRRKKDGSEEVVPFMLKDRPAELFLEHYVAKWREAYPDRGYPRSPLLDEFFDPLLKQRRLIERWFADLPPAGNLSAAQRLQVDAFRVQLARLVEGKAARELRIPNMQSSGGWSAADWKHVDAVLAAARDGTERGGRRSLVRYRLGKRRDADGLEIEEVVYNGAA